MSGRRLTPDRRSDAVLSVTLDEIAMQRVSGWRDFGSEDFCRRCGQRNIPSWYVASDLWNAVMRPEGEKSERWHIICPQCFVGLYEASFGETVWELKLDVGSRPVVTNMTRRADE